MNKTRIEHNQINRIVQIPANGIELEGALVIPSKAKGVVLFAHGSGSSRHSPRNNFVAQVLHRAGMGTLLMDLLHHRGRFDLRNRFDIDLLTWRLERATQWIMEQPRSTVARYRIFSARAPARRRRCRPQRRSVHRLVPWCHAAAVQTWPCRRWTESNRRHC